MKKYITIAALLAAGTAFANAADVGTASFGTDVVSAGTNIGSLTLLEDMTKGTPTNWRLQTPSKSADPQNLPNIRGGDFYAGDYTLSIWVDENTFNSEGETLLFAYSGSLDSNDYGYNAIAWDATNKCLKMGRGNFTATNMSMAWKETTSSQSIELVDGLNNITIAVSGANQSQTPTFWINGVDNGTATEYKGNMNNNETYMGYYVNTSLTYGDISLTNEKLTSLEAIKGLATPAPIPEPSAFGLLAGIGALALVASRRRRK